ncbi:MAG TPA: endonuclease/exonuclease/phosphatase family protein, partial [Planctomycetota bacterium]|nr:endonuclease/exonuclease/phosphatase family protein [Planctomycetota bacterium]
FRICQYNVHFDYTDDGPTHRWVTRRDRCAELLLQCKATIACIQEDKADQVQDLKDRMPGWEFVGRGRNANGSGERTSICFKTDTWKCLDHGDFWLSDTPDTPGSNTFGSEYCHKATWAKMELTAHGSTGQVTVISTHLDDRPPMDEPRRKSAVCIRNYVRDHFKKDNIVICGDFNSAVTDESHKVMADTSIEPPLYDTWDCSKHNEPSSGTVHHWTGTAKTKRIDWIFIGGKVSADSMNFDRYNKNGDYGSYHFAVCADLELGAGSSTKPAAAPKPEGKASDKPAVSGDPVVAKPTADQPKPAAEPLKPTGKPWEEPSATQPAEKGPDTSGVPDSPPPFEPGLSPLDPPVNPIKKN